MKSQYLFAILFLSAVAHCQIINFPDPAFKARLLTSNPSWNPVAYGQNNEYIIIDSNSDGEIDEDEALAVYYMSLGAGDIVDITGIAYFSNLVEIRIYDNPIVSIDITSLSNLTFFECNWTDTLESLTLNTAVEELRLYWNQLSALDISNCPNLKKLICPHNQLSALNLTNNLMLTDLNCSQNQISVLDVGHLVNLRGLDCSANNISVLDVSDLSQLIGLGCANNQIAVLDVSNKPYMNFLDLSHNQVSILDLGGTGNLAEISLFFFIDCSYNNLQSVDTSVVGQGIPIQLLCNYNPNLSFINLKNGVTFYDYIFTEPPLPGPGVYFEGLPSLTYICADPVNFNYLEGKIDQYGYNDCTIDSSCQLAADDFSQQDITFYPNPVIDILNIEMTADTAIKSLIIYNLLGQLVLSLNNPQEINAIDVSDLRTGSYFIKIYSDKGTSNMQFLKQ